MPREKLAPRRGQLLFEFDFAGVGHTAGLGLYDDGRPSELFLDCHKHGNALAENAHDAAVLVSLSLQHGVPLATIYGAVNREADGMASGVVGAALDTLKADMPDLFEAPPAEPVENPEIEVLRAENADLHDQVAALSDELQQLSDGKCYLEPIPRRATRQALYLATAHSIWGDAAIDRDERWRRFAEECLEAIQTKFNRSEFAKIARYVYDRKIGEPQQELGGVQTTLLALCAVEGWDADELEVREYKRVLAKDPNTLRARHQQKVDAGVAMQGTPAVTLLNACLDCPAPLSCTKDNRCAKDHEEKHLYGKSCEPVNTGIPATGSFE